jgi:hypothetical protein
VLTRGGKSECRFYPFFMVVVFNELDIFLSQLQASLKGPIKYGKIDYLVLSLNCHNKLVYVGDID